MEPQPRTHRGLLLGIALLVALWFGLVFWFGPESPTSHNAGRADYAWRLEDLDGQPVDFARYKGKVIFLNRWATWCGPCVAELPSIDRLARHPELNDVVFLAVSDEDPDSLRRFVRDRNVTVPVLRSPGNIPAVFDTAAIPATFLIAPDGRIATRVIGSSDWDSPETVKALTDLARPPAS